MSIGSSCSRARTNRFLDFIGSVLISTDLPSLLVIVLVTEGFFVFDEEEQILVPTKGNGTCDCAASHQCGPVLLFRSPIHYVAIIHN